MIRDAVQDISNEEITAYLKTRGHLRRLPESIKEEIESRQRWLEGLVAGDKNTIRRAKLVAMVEGWYSADDLPRCLGGCGNPARPRKTVATFDATCSKKCELVLFSKTSASRYGTANPNQSEEIQYKIRNTNLMRYGTEYTGSVAEFREKGKQTTLERYGVDHYSKTDEFKNRMREFSLGKYGTENPFQSEEVKDLSRKTMIEKYGVEYSMQSKDIMDKAVETNLVRYGVEHYSKTMESKLRRMDTLGSRYGVTHPSRIGMNRETVGVLDDPEALTDLFEERGAILGAKDLQVHPSTIYDNMHRHGIGDNITGGGSAGETELFEEILKLFPDAERSNRTIISPKEIDIIIPSLRVGIEYNGLWWHSTAHKSLEHLQEKTNLAESSGWHMIHVFEDEWVTDKEKTMARIIKAIKGGYTEDCVHADFRYDSASKLQEDGYIVDEDIPIRYWFVCNVERLDIGAGNLPMICDLGGAIMKKPSN